MESNRMSRTLDKEKGKEGRLEFNMWKTASGCSPSPLPGDIVCVPLWIPQQSFTLLHHPHSISLDSNFVELLCFSSENTSQDKTRQIQRRWVNLFWRKIINDCDWVIRELRAHLFRDESTVTIRLLSCCCQSQQLHLMIICLLIIPLLLLLLTIYHNPPLVTPASLLQHHFFIIINTHTLLSLCYHSSFREKEIESTTRDNRRKLESFHTITHIIFTHPPTSFTEGVYNM